MKYLNLVQLGKKSQRCWVRWLGCIIVDANSISVGHTTSHQLRSAPWTSSRLTPKTTSPPPPPTQHHSFFRNLPPLFKKFACNFDVTTQSEYSEIKLQVVMHRLSFLTKNCLWYLSLFHLLLIYKNITFYNILVSISKSKFFNTFKASLCFLRLVYLFL